MRLYTRSEAAKIIGISINTLDLARKQREISYIQHRPNGKVFFREADLDEYISRNTHQAIPVRGKNKKTR